ncbi:3'-5' exonuclease [Kriegella aquimaris]|uniref:DNA polymerase-3 subunit epsilon n=1 Tax=Kriegella aquimaris TaxID=192904 RepID=A0A1G9JLI2_9FLAO|nr:3'-5' exonuclease [Kriegella aquimaris]SDL38399.1 DNA polymerase-3 subunit epsilon [Kriegella aquimaris]
MQFFKKKKVHYPDFWYAYENSFKQKQATELKDVRFVVLDTETTGFDYGEDRMLSIGALALKDNTIAVGEAFEVFLDQYFYHAKNVQIHGILRDERKNRVTELEALQKFLAFVGNSVLVAHHAGFDITMLNCALRRHGMPKLLNKVLDTSTLYKRTLIQSPLLKKKEHYSLDELADKFNITKRDRHTALGDTYITAIAFLKILEKLKKKGKFSVKKLLK